jgi:tetratricopeptide (TPR) repeat protein
MFRRSHRSFLVFRLIILAFLLLLGFVLVQQLRRRAALEEQVVSVPTPEEVEVRINSILDFEGDVRSQLIMDELRRIEEAEIPEAGELPLSAHWIKQAAYHLLRAEMAYADGEWERAIRSYRTALRIYPEMEGVRERIGLCYMQLNEYAESEEAFAGALAENTNEFRLMNNLGVAHLAEKDFADAEPLLLEALERDPGYLPAHHNLALLYYQQDELEKSREHFKTYFEQGRIDVEALQIYTRVLIELERWDEAATLLNSSSQILPKAAPVHLRLAQVLSQLGRGEEAMQALRRGLDLLDGPTALAMVASTDFDRLRDRNDFKQLVSELATRVR